MTIKLPPLPEMVQIDRHIPTNYVIRGYTAEQMEAYAREAVRLNMAPLSDEQTADPCLGCKVGHVCRPPKCGRLKLPTDHPLRTGIKGD